MLITAYLKDFDNTFIDDANEKLLQEPSPIYNVENDAGFQLNQSC
jgi:hypothetical protein